jgi:hypothetical protein
MCYLKVFILKQRHKCNSRVPAPQGRKYLRFSFAVFSFSLLISSRRFTSKSVFWFVFSYAFEPNLGRLISHRFDYSTKIACLFLFIHFIWGNWKNIFSLLLLPWISKDIAWLPVAKVDAKASGAPTHHCWLDLASKTICKSRGRTQTPPWS